ncbi:MAG: hypothetical protein H0T41_11040 [Rhodobacteraceae bacterium]|nr:hypothetical protein [Paracoccaceae bacterium]
MYLPENDAQMFDILTELRLYAQLNALPGLAEEIDDAIVVLAVETRRNAGSKPAAPRAEDRR